MLKYASLFMAALLVVGCASSPDELTASYVSPMQYRRYDCDQIAEEAANIERRVAELYGQLDKKASTDNVQMGVGLVLLWPTLFFLEGGDGADAVEYRRLRGEYEALQKASVQKKCKLEFNIQQALPKKKPPVQEDEVSKRMKG